MDDQTISWKLLDLTADDQEDNNSSAPEVLSLVSWDIHVLYGAYNTGQNYSDWELQTSQELLQHFQKLTC